ncbi:MAG TPA: hypothetical protein PLL75_08045 [Candidatus Omnitrophota bacterium]|nr:hypothetical protein [Candidatus Omnitrophota bacterium]HPS37658.1 hypothetical protein [Candidatus Omnitrophota bacterium]
MIKKIFWVTFIMLGVMQTVSFAAVTIDNRAGTLNITQPDGSVISVGPNEPLPVIQDGATVEAVNGSVQVSTTDGSTAKVVIGGQVLQISAGTTVNQTRDPSGSVSFEVTSGQAILLTTDGGTATLGVGTQILLNGPVENAAGLNVVKGEVTFVDASGNTTTIAGTPSVGGYQPPAIPDTTLVDTSVQTEEDSRDISPVNT